jgi:hypothetical protein
MPRLVQLDLRGLPRVNALLDEFRGTRLTNRVRRSVRTAVRPIRDALRRRGRSGRYPRGFRNTRTRDHRTRGIGVSIGPASRLSPIFEHGARPHAIPISRGPWAGVTARHPGMLARPISGPAFDESQDAAEREFADTLFGGL